MKRDSAKQDSAKRDSAKRDGTVFYTLQVVNCFKVESDATLLLS